MATVAITPLELYLQTSFEPDAEFVDGEVEERPMGEYDHSNWQLAIYAWFKQHAEQWSIRCSVELRVQVSPTRYRVPDVVVFDRNLPIEQVITHAPIAVVEILSPEDMMSRLLRKLEDYATMGIRNIWVLDPTTATAYRYIDGGLLKSGLKPEALDHSTATVDWAAIADLRD